MQPFLEKYKKQLLIPGGIIIAFFLYFFFTNESSNDFTIETIDERALASIEASTTNSSELEENEYVPQQIIVDVKGAVNYPGVYTLSEQERIVDAIEAAGGYTNDANPTLINHAQKLQDEMVIYISKMGEDASETMDQLVQITTTSSSISSGTGPGKINLNKAIDSELTQLPGIGPSKARAIIQYRSEQGNFKTIDDLKQVTGIGEKTFEQLKDLIDVK